MVTGGINSEALNEFAFNSNAHFLFERFPRNYSMQAIFLRFLAFPKCITKSHSDDKFVNVSKKKPTITFKRDGDNKCRVL